MSRTTIDFGIDLGTTNSAIAVLKGVTTEIIKNNVDADITPSAVSIDKKGVVHLGERAKSRLIDYGEDTYLQFKRSMGTDYIYRFKSSGRTAKPEDLSAEVLKSLRAEVQQRTGELVEAAVITVPAAFELHQCDATRNAAQLAGLRESPLLMEPTAASLAYGFQRESRKAYWLVYDFGGGTFDAALMKAEEGTINMVNHGGDNFLGGSDIDWAIVEKLIVPRILEEFDLEDFARANAGVGSRWYRAFTRLKFAAEDAKIELTRRESMNLNWSNYARNLIDDLTHETVIEELDMEISRRELIALAEPFILRATEIASRVLKEKSLSAKDVERVILVGGPTLAGYFREIVSAELGIPLDLSVDPLTVVARGAAVFAGTQRFNTGASVPTPTGEYSVDLKHKPVGMDSAPMVGGKVTGPSTRDFTGFTLELVNTKTQWRSGKISLRPDGVFIANLHAERGERNTFAIELSDLTGRKQKTTPDTLTYTVGAVVDEQPLINSMGIALANNEYARFFKKGDGLPQRKSWPEPFHTAKPLKQGQSGEFIWIPVIEGENELADRNRLIKKVAIAADNIRRDLPVGSEVDITLKIDESRMVLMEAYVPFLDEEFKFKIDLRDRPCPDAALLKEDFDVEIKRFYELKAKAAEAGGESAEELVKQVERSPILQDVIESLAAAKGDPDAAAKCEKRLQELKPKLDEIANSLEWPALVEKAKDWLDYLKKVVDQHGNDQQSQKAEDLADEVEEIIRERKTERLRKKIDQISRLYFDIVTAQPGWWVNQFQQMEKQRQKITDQGRAARLLDQGRDCMAKNNITGLQNVVRQLWELSPKEIVDEAKRRDGGDLTW
jgi:molecular chaperone DnaK